MVFPIGAQRIVGDVFLTTRIKTMTSALAGTGFQFQTGTALAAARRLVPTLGFSQGRSVFAPTFKAAGPGPVHPSVIDQERQKRRDEAFEKSRLPAHVNVPEQHREPPRTPPRTDIDGNEIPENEGGERGVAIIDFTI